MRQPRRPEDLRYTRTMDKRATLDRGRDAWIDLPTAGGTDCFLTPERTDLTPGASITCASSRCAPGHPLVLFLAPVARRMQLIAWCLQTSDLPETNLSTPK